MSEVETKEKCAACKEKMLCDVLAFYEKQSDGVSTSRQAWNFYYRIFVALYYYPEPKPFHVSEEEAEFIRGLFKDGYSHDDLAFITQRSKSTINDVLNKKAREQ